MKRSFLLIPLVLLGVLIFRRGTIHESPQMPILKMPPIEVSQAEAEALVSRLNEQNKKIKTFSCQNVDIAIEGHPLLILDATLAYEKSRHFRMVTTSLLGTESDIGSNDSVFWFWSKRMNPPALHYADYKDIHKTRLKTPFHPVWMMESLGLDEIQLEPGTYVGRNSNLWYIYTMSSSVMGRPVIRVKVIDAEKLCVIASHIFEGGRCVASSQITENFKHNDIWVPQKIVVSWHEENVVMTWTLNDPIVNANLSQDQWKIPQISPMINMGEG